MKFAIQERHAERERKRKGAGGVCVSVRVRVRGGKMFSKNECIMLLVREKINQTR